MKIVNGFYDAYNHRFCNKEICGTITACGNVNFTACGTYLVIYMNNKKQETRNKKQETRNKKQETRNKKQETRNKKQETRNKKLL